MGDNAFHFFDIIVHGFLYCAGLSAREEAQIQPAHVIQNPHTQTAERMKGTGVANKAADYRKHHANDNAC